MPYVPSYYASGTAALAAAIIAAINRKTVDRPEVILPAYGCPDIVSAAVYAGATPVLVDLLPDSPWMDPDQLATRLGDNTVAIIAVSLFGIPEQMASLRQLAEQAGAVLIEDSSQAFPSNREQSIWQGDLIVLSFGRGKPVSLLGGGAVLHRDGLLAQWLPHGSIKTAQNWRTRLAMRTKIHLYNKMISPHLYWLPDSLPFLHLGETRYHPLSDIQAMEADRQALLPTNIMAYQSDGLITQKKLASLLDEFDVPEALLFNLAARYQAVDQHRLLRYPLLVDPAIRDRLYLELKRSGLGPSKMYPLAMPAIPGLEKLLPGQHHFPQAEAFATRVLTLPTHQRFGQKDFLRLRRVLANILE